MTDEPGLEPVPEIQFQKVSERTLKSRMIASLRQRPTRGIGLVIILIIVLAAIFAPAITPQDPTQVSLQLRLRPPFWMEDSVSPHFLGTDQLGRDIWTRIVYGARVSLIIGLLAMLVAGPIGVFTGVIAGYRGRSSDTVIMRIADAQLAIPSILLAVTIIAVLGRSLLILIVVLGVTKWVEYARISRAESLYLKETDFVLASRVVGAKTPRIMSRHILPNLMTPIIVLASFTVAEMILAEAALSFLGLGVQPPTPSWGSMISDGRDYLSNAWWVAAWPGLAILITVLAINFVGDWLTEVLHPRSVL
ncbi:MAG: ABC transporter permease [Chloroflexi bacterium]|nr:ABC transporter permease [Chloroflexota bacterium]